MRLTAKIAKQIWWYDPATGYIYWKIGGVGRRKNRPCGCRTDRYVRLYYARRSYQAHNVIWLMVTGRWPKHEVDHKNNVPWDNRWNNLREATPSQNSFSAIRSSNSSGLRGVYLDRGRWYARITVRRKQMGLGYFNTPEQAHAAYITAAKKHFGEFARAQ